MSEKVVVIYVSRQFRDKIKAKKHELTYEKYLDNLIRKEKGENSHSPSSKLNPMAKKDLIN